MADLVVIIDNYTIHGKSAVLSEGYVYIFDTYLSLGKKRWKCINYSTCKAYLWVDEGFIVKRGGIHTHEVEPERIEARKRVQTFKADVVAQRHSHLDGLTASARDCETVIRDAMPSTKAMKRTARRHRVKVCSLLKFCGVCPVLFCPVT
jgi:hypothetical protein